MMHPTTNPADLPDAWLDCPHCHWQGRAKDAVVVKTGGLCCPKCGGALERKGQRGQGYITK